MAPALDKDLQCPWAQEPPQVTRWLPDSWRVVWDPAPLCVFVLDKVKPGEPGPWLVVRAGEL